MWISSSIFGFDRWVYAALPSEAEDDELSYHSVFSPPEERSIRDSHTISVLYFFCPA